MTDFSYLYFITIMLFNMIKIKTLKTYESFNLYNTSVTGLNSPDSFSDEVDNLQFKRFILMIT